MILVRICANPDCPTIGPEGRGSFRYPHRHVLFCSDACRDAAHAKYKAWARRGEGRGIDDIPGTIEKLMERFDLAPDKSIGELRWEKTSETKHVLKEGDVERASVINYSRPGEPQRWNAVCGNDVIQAQDIDAVYLDTNLRGAKAVAEAMFTGDPTDLVMQSITTEHRTEELWFELRSLLSLIGRSRQGT